LQKTRQYNIYIDIHKIGICNKMEHVELFKQQASSHFTKVT